ncbi:GIY-YIG nuclease family protein [Marivirga atlantica]|jgi:putative endonuclease|uniref:GIY-YIG nuclease family protein n=1 Tax=Marivirga atlantica TaxID=1548457 RepID=A0A937AL56_9BACT|nr:GIY-YIG nuclease family protein [Marivirga atlantica]MBL0764712.1 GIY-YIG nuclease family protein [Marivirga atlantica]
MRAKGGYVYIVSNVIRSVLYIGVTSNLSARSSEHKHGEGSQFTKKYKCTDLIYYEVFESIEEAIAREKVLKKWNRKWKLELIRKMNPNLKDLYDEVEDFK